MFAEEEKKITQGSDTKHDYYASYFDELDNDDEADELEVKKSKKVTIEEPKEEEMPKKFEWTNLGNLSILSAFATIALVVLGKLFVIIGAVTAGYVFYWIGGLCLLASLGFYVAQMVKNHLVKFEPQLIILILAIVALLI